MVDVTPHPEHPPEYIGDGVYASFDGYSIILSAERPIGFFGTGDGKIASLQLTTHWIALEPDVFEALKGYAERVWHE